FPVKETKIPDVTNGAGAIQNNAWPTQPEAGGGAGQILPHCMTAAVGAQMIPGYPTAPNGTPIIPTRQYASPTSQQYVLMYPAHGGGINWNREAYSPQTNDMYVCAGVSVIAEENTSPTSGAMISLGVNGTEGGTISALNMSTNKLDWQVKIPAAFTTP